MLDGGINMIPTYDSFVQQLSVTEEWQELNKHRRIAIRRRILSWPLGFAILIIGLLMIIFGSDGDTIFGGFGALVMSVVMVVIMYRLSHKYYSGYYKKLVVPQLVADVIKSSSSTDVKGKIKNYCKFNHEEHINEDLLLSIPLFQKYNHSKISFEGEDLFSGTLGETDFQFSDFVF